MADSSNSPRPPPGGGSGRKRRRSREAPAGGRGEPADDARRRLEETFDDVDPELARLPRPRPRVGPLLSASIVVFCVYLMAVLWSDLRFSRNGSHPRPLASPAALADHAGGAAFVSVHAVPDRAFAVRASPSKGTEDGYRIAPVLGQGDRVWLAMQGSPWNAPISYAEVYAGRPRRIGDLPFADALRAYVNKQPPALRFVAAAALVRAVAAHAARVRTLTGDVLPVRAKTPMSIAERVPGRIQITALAGKNHPNRASWTAALTKAGVIPAGAGPVASAARAWTYVAAAPDGIPAVRARLAAANLFGAHVDPLVAHHDTTFGALGARAGALVIDGHALAPATIASASLAVRHTIPDGAVILFTTERPGAYWYVLPLYIALALFAALFAWAFVRAVRAALAASRSRAA